MTPLISVVMPVYNGERFLREAIDSILNQTCADFEFIIVDDGSTDFTPEILSDCQHRDHRIVVQRQQKNQGIVAALNLGCSLAKGQFIARMDADDISLPERFEQQVVAFETNQSLALVGTFAATLNENGDITGQLTMPVHPGEVKWGLIFGNCFIHSSVMIRTAVALAHGFYRIGFDYAEDYEFWSRLSSDNLIANIPVVLIKHRIWGESLTSRKKTEQKAIADAISRALIMRYLGEDISEQAVRTLIDTRNLVPELQVETYPNLKNAGLLLQRLTRVFPTFAHLSQVESQIVSRDIAQLFYKLASSMRKYSKKDALWLAVSGFRRDPNSIRSWARTIRNRLVLTKASGL